MESELEETFFYYKHDLIDDLFLAIQGSPLSLARDCLLLCLAKMVFILFHFVYKKFYVVYSGSLTPNSLD